MLFYLFMVPSILQTSNNSQLTQVRKARPGSVEFREQVEVALEKCPMSTPRSMSMSMSMSAMMGWLLSNWLPRLSEKLSQCFFFIFCINFFCNLSSFILIKSQSVMRFHGIWTKEGGHLRRFSCDTDSDSDMRIM